MPTLPIDPTSIASTWLSTFTTYLSTPTPDLLHTLFLPDGWFRDALTFTWDTRTLHGYTQIAQYLDTHLPSTGPIKGVKLIEHDMYLGPVSEVISAGKEGVSAGFLFETDVVKGRGYFALLRDGKEGEGGEWKAFTVFMGIDSIKGYEERGAERGVYEGHTLSWGEVKERRWREAEEDPYVLVVGAGQNGLQVAARLQQLNIPTLTVEINERVGDQWRKRYPMLTLHTPKEHHAMLYQPYPSTWPLFTPRDKVASWLEQYAINQDLPLWTSSYPLSNPGPSYDPTTKKWTVTINKSGTHKTLHPAHIVLATGQLGQPNIPKIPGISSFQGRILHSSEYNGGAQYSGSRCVVIGTGNSGADISQDLSCNGAKAITMVQRSPICVQSSKTSVKLLHMAYPPGVPTDVCDFRNEAKPLKVVHGVVKEVMNGPNGGEGGGGLWEEEKELFEGLKKAGMLVNKGPDGAGLLPLTVQKFGKFFLDVGCGERIISGQIKIKSGVEVERVEENNVVFTDGSSVEADVIIMATGFTHFRETLSDLFGEEFVGKTKPVWGMDEEGELRAAYRSSGHPGFWFAPGGFNDSRVGSKYLGLQIKAIQLGLIEV